MERKRQRELTLAALAVLLAAVVAWRVQSGSPAAAPGPATPAANRSTTASKGAAAEVDLQALQAERPEPIESNRNPFTFRPKGSLPVEAQPPRSGASAGGQSGAPGFAQPSSEPPMPPAIPMKFIGIIRSPDPNVSDLAVLSDGRGVYQGREGDIIEGRYRIIKIGIESIELAHLDGRGSQTIGLTGQ